MSNHKKNKKISIFKVPKPKGKKVRLLRLRCQSVYMSVAKLYIS